jgi:uncharacterized FlaG/YvyC family protein
MNDDISGTGQFAGLSAVDPVPAYKPPETATRPPAAASLAPRIFGSDPAGAAAVDAAQAAAADSQLGAAQRSAADSSHSSGGGPAPSRRVPTAEEIAAAVSAANANLASSDRSLAYRVDAATGISIAMIRNTQTGAVLQQIPGADIIALARMLADWAPGKHMLLDLIA